MKKKNSTVSFYRRIIAWRPAAWLRYKSFDSQSSEWSPLAWIDRVCKSIWCGLLHGGTPNILEITPIQSQTSLPVGTRSCLEKEIDHLSQRRRATLCLFSDSTMCIEFLSCRNMPRPSRDIMVIDRCFFTIETTNANVSKSIDRSIIDARILFLRSVIIQLRIFIQIHILASIIESVYDLDGDLCHPLKMKST